MELRLVEDRQVERPLYQTPEIKSFSDEDILETLGPARTLYQCDINNPCP